MAPVSRVTIHHEGAGTPSDVARGAAGGYSIWIGLQRYTILRDPHISFATLRFNHVSLDICLSGNRMVCPVTDSDIALISAAVAEARANGWVTDAPEVVPHRNSPGSSTVCPGDLTMARWGDVVLACQKPHAAPPPPPPPPIVWKVMPQYDPPIDVFGGVRASLQVGGGCLLIGPLGHLYAIDGAPNLGGPIDDKGEVKPYFAGKQVSKLEHPNKEEAAAHKVYTVIANDGARYSYPE